MPDLRDIQTVASLPGEPSHVSAAGITRAGSRLVTLENPDPFSGDRTRRRLVMVADDERAGQAALDAIRWFKTTAARSARDRWSLSVLFCSSASDARPLAQLEFPPAKGFFDHAGEPESRYAWRWATYQAPDILLQIRGGDVMSRATPPAGSLAAAMAGGSEMGTAAVVFATARERDGMSLLQHLMQDDGNATASEIRATLQGRTARPPLELAQVLARRYPQNPSVSYIPSLSWLNALRLADATGESALTQKVMQQVDPWMSRKQPLFGERITLTAVAGTMIYAELAGRGQEAARDLAVQGAEAALKMAPSGVAEYGQGWTDDMFMMSSILARSARPLGRARDLDELAKRLVAYAQRLQRPDGIFVHFTEGRIPWGRGNGFAALGLTEALTSMPGGHPLRQSVLDVYRRHMAGLKTMQAPDGMWRQVIDEPGAYREQTATAMTLTAMARGVRLGWLDRTYQPVIDRAWRALAAHITDDGGIVDVCTSTGSGADLRFYLDRAAISGSDDRGGAMGLQASMEMISFHKTATATPAGSR